MNTKNPENSLMRKTKKDLVDIILRKDCNERAKNARIDEIGTTCSKLTEELNESVKKYLALDSNYKSVLSDLENAKKTIKDLTSEKSTIANRNANCLKDADKAIKENVSLRASIKELETKLKNGKRDRDSMCAQLESFRREINDCRDIIDEKSRKLKVTKSKKKVFATVMLLSLLVNVVLLILLLV